MGISPSRSMFFLSVLTIAIAWRATAAEPGQLWQKQVSPPLRHVDLRLSLTTDGQTMRVADRPKIIRLAADDGELLAENIPPPDITQLGNDSFDILAIGYQDEDYLLAGERFPGGHPRLLRWNGHSPDALAGWEGAERRPLDAVAHHPPTGQVVTLGLVVEDSILRGALRLHDPDSLVPTNQVSFRGEPTTVQFSRSGEFVMATGDATGGIVVWRPAPPGRVFNLYPPIDYFETNNPIVRINSFAVSATDLVAYGGLEGDLAELTFYDKPGVIFVHRLPGGEVVRALQGHGHPVGPVAFVGEGDVLMSTDGETLRFWHMTDGRQLLVLPGLPVGFRGGVWLGSPLVAPDTTWFAIHGPQQGQVTVYRMPLLLTHSSIVGEQLEVRWVGGSGRYQVQRSPSPDGAWEDTGEILSERIATLPTTPERGFFRVVSVGE